MTNSVIYGTAIGGTVVSAVGTGLQTSEVLQWISLAITILGAIVSFIVIPILNWWKDYKNKEDKSVDDIKEVANIVKDGLDATKEVVDSINERKEDTNDNQGDS